MVEEMILLDSRGRRCLLDQDRLSDGRRHGTMAGEKHYLI